MTTGTALLVLVLTQYFSFYCATSLFNNLIVVNSVPNALWTGICMSTDGRFLAAVSDRIYVSNDYGYEWTLSFSDYSDGNDITCSGTGKQLVAVASDGIFLSFDYGTTWNKSSSTDAASVSSSSSGQHVYAATKSGVTMSANYGQNWTKSALNADTLQIACSADGRYVTTIGEIGIVYISNDFGLTFNAVLHFDDWLAVAISGTGQYVTVVANSEFVYISGDYGNSWKQSSVANVWTAAAISHNGSVQVAVAYNSTWYYSQDYGSTWTTVDNIEAWKSVTVSATGECFAAGTFGSVFVFSTASQLFSDPANQLTIPPSTVPTDSPTDQIEYSYELVKMFSAFLTDCDVTSSYSGQYIFVLDFLVGIYSSNNFGNSFSLTYDAELEGYDISCSSSGQYVYTVAYDSLVNASYDYGITWTSLPNSPRLPWEYVATNGTGEMIYAVTSTGSLYFSRDTGTTWTIYAEVIYGPIACSQSGQYVTAVYSTTLYYSETYGATFKTSVSPSSAWISASMSSSGQYQIASSKNSTLHGSGIVVISSNYGATWSETPLSDQTWTVTISSTGEYMFAAAYGGGVYWSSDYGVKWFNSGSPSKNWYSLTVSANGQYLVGSVTNGGIYTNHYNIPTSVPSRSPSGQPTVVPSSPSSNPTQPQLPTLRPSSCPSSQPSSYPTYVPDTLDTTVVVQSYTANSTHVFNNLGCGSHAYIGATILVSFLTATSTGFLSIWATDESGNVITITESCAPDSLCGSIACAVNVNVTSVLSCSRGGSISVFAATVNANEQSGVDTLCTYHGTPGLQYAVSYTLSVDPLPTAQPTEIPTIEVPGNIVFEANPNTPFYIIVTFALLYAILGVFVVRVRDKSGMSFSEMKLTSTCFDMALIGYHLMSEMFYINVLFAEHLCAVGGVIITIRILSVFSAMYFLFLIFGRTANYDNMLNKQHLYKNAALYSVVIVGMLFEQAMVRYLPWNGNEYTVQSRGFPDHWLFRVCVLSKLSQLISSLIVQVVVLAHYDAYLFKNRSDSIALALVLLYLVASVGTVVMFTITSLVRLKAGETTKFQDGEGAVVKNLPLQAMEMVDLKEHGKREETVSLLRLTSILEERDRAWEKKLKDQNEENKEWRNRLADLESRLSNAS